MKTLSPQGQENFISTAMRLKYEGIKEGEIKGKVEMGEFVVINCILKGYNNQTIKELTGFTDLEIDKIRNEITNSINEKK